MFSGIIEAIGRVQNLQPLKKGLRIMIEAPFHFETDVKLGESISVNGTCLTVTEWKKSCFLADVSPETLDKTYFGELSVGDSVNLERALKFSDRMNGHLVTGHIDGLGKIKKIKKEDEFSKYIFKCDKNLREMIVKKGSIAIDGISLTVNDCSNKNVEVMIIPETLKKTTLGQKKSGDRVQIEFDIIGKYIKKYVKR